MPTDTLAPAMRFANRVNTLMAAGQNSRDAVSLAQRDDEAGAYAYRLEGVGATEVPAVAPVVSLSVKTGESFDEVATRYAAEHKVPLRQAITEVGRMRPDLALAR